jgi:hypothetical protein
MIFSFLHTILVGDFVAELASGLIGKPLSELPQMLAVTARTMSLCSTSSLFHMILLLIRF